MFLGSSHNVPSETHLFFCIIILFLSFILFRFQKDEKELKTIKLISILKKIQNVKIIDVSIENSNYIPLNLSKSNKDLEEFNCDNAQEFDNYIEKYLKENNAKIAFGGYNEVRNLYKRSTIFKSENQKERNIHIGLDLWIKAETSILAALDGKIHSFKNNLGLGNYGPTIILVHEIENVKFYTLYGHLSEKSIENLEIGKEVKKGSQIATLGDFNVNGNYGAHLHFQIIEDIQGNFGDYPGVCNINDLDFYLKNCPNPNLLLKISE